MLLVIQVLYHTRFSQHFTNFSHTAFAVWSPFFICFGVNPPRRRHGLNIRKTTPPCPPRRGGFPSPSLSGKDLGWGGLLQMLKDSAPLKLPARHCLFLVLPERLENMSLQSGISLTDQHLPRETSQILPPMLRSKNISSMPSCSKASGVFSSNCR